MQVDAQQGDYDFIAPLVLLKRRRLIFIFLMFFNLKTILGHGLKVFVAYLASFLDILIK